MLYDITIDYHERYDGSAIPEVSQFYPAPPGAALSLRPSQLVTLTG